MILGILLLCASPVDAVSCMPIPNPQKLYATMEECELEANAIAQAASVQYFAKAFCFETDFFELL
jgi:hypothetical protein